MLTNASQANAVLFEQSVETAARIYFAAERLPPSVIVDCMERLALGAVRKVARDWNLLRSPTRQLPSEMIVRCMKPLRQTDIIRASHVCASWRHTIVAAPELWTDLEHRITNLTDSTGLLVLSLQRASHAPVRLKITVHGKNALPAIAQCLKLHLHHIRHLHIDGVSVLWTEVVHALATLAPILETFIVRGTPFPVLDNLFQGYAPRLRMVDIEGASFATVCSAFRHVSVLHFTGLRGVPQLPGNMPDGAPAWASLSELHLHNVRTPHILRLIPSAVRIAKLVLYPWNKLDGQDVGEIMRLSATLHLKELDLYRCDVAVADVVLRDGTYGAADVLTILPVGSSALALTMRSRTSEQQSCTIRSDSYPHADMAVFLSTCSALSHLTRLEIFSDVLVNPARLARWAKHGALAFPATELPYLDTLCLIGGFDAAWTLYDPGVLKYCGILRAPALRSLRLQCTEDALRAPFKPVNPRTLALFIGNHLAFATELLPELTLGVSSGVALHDEDDGGAGMDILRSYVAKIVVL